MRQFLIAWGPLVIPSYGFFVGMACIILMHLSEQRAQFLKMKRFLILDSLMLGLVAAYFGASIFYFLLGGEKGESLIPESHARSIFGAMAAGIAVLYLYLKSQKAHILKSFDIIFMYFPLAQSIGRIGCLCYGCCHGRVSHWNFFTLQFQKIIDPAGKIVGTPAFSTHLERGLIHANAQYSLPVYPTQPFAILTLLSIFIILRILSDKEYFRFHPGSILFSFCIMDGIQRIIEEIFREHYRYYGIYSKPQIVSLIMLIIGIYGLLKVSKTKPHSISKDRKANRKVISP